MNNQIRERNIKANLESYKVKAAFYEVGSPHMFNLFEQRRLRSALELLLASVPRNSLALDLGSGTGNVAKHLKRLGLNVIVADLSEEMLRNNPIRQRIVCDAHNLPLKEGHFSVITTYSFFHHCYDPQMVLSEVCRVAAPNCILYFGWDSFIRSEDTKPPIRWLATNLKGLVGWILWLVSRPSRIARLFAYLFLHRRRYMQKLRGEFNCAEIEGTPLVTIDGFMDCLKQAGFQIIRLDRKELIARR